MPEQFFMKKYLLLLAFGTALTACSGEKFSPGPEMSLNHSYKNKASLKGDVIDPTTKWWANFGDQNLNRLIDEALAENISVEQARERIRAARSSAKIAQNTYMPGLDANGSAAYGRKKIESVDKTLKTTAVGADVTGSWLIDFLGAKSTADSSYANIEQQKEALNTARLDVISAVATQYLLVQGLGRQISIAQKSLQVQNETARITLAKLEAGTASSLDSTRALGAAALTASDIPVLQQQRETAINQIAILLAKEPVEFNNLFSKFEGVKRPRVKFGEGIPADLLRNRPDVRQAEWALRQAMAEIGIAEAQLWPTIQLTGQVAAVRLPNPRAYTWGFGPTINIPIFDRGALKANVDLNKSTARIQYLEYRQTVLNAVADVENAVIAVRAEQRRDAQLLIAVREYAKAEVLARQLNDAGTTEFSDVLDAQSSLYSAQLQQAASAVLVATNYVALCQALGGGWAGNEPVMDEDLKSKKTN
jgi:multidrug efflux system outer membrane protein